MAGGQSITSGQGTATPSGTVPVAGSAVSTAAGTLSADLGPTLEALTGSEFTPAAGTAVSGIILSLRSRKVGGGAASRALSGASMSAAQQSIPALLSSTPSGIAGTLSQGAFTKTRVAALLGGSVSATPGTVSAPSNAPSGAALAFFALPSLADERATYDLLGWTRTIGDEAFDFIDLGAITTTDTHDDSEGDDLWTWDAQQRRGYADAIVGTFRSRWLTYFKTGLYRADLIANDANRGDIEAITSADPFCHGYGIGLTTIGYINADATAITEAEAIADVGLNALFGGTTSANYPAATGADFGYGGGRQMARIGQLVANLAYATGKSKWIGWLKAMTDAYLGASTWADTSSGLGIVQGGAYFCDRDWMDNNGQQGPAAYDAGARSNSIYQYGMHGEFLWRAYLVTKRADVRDRIIAFARFMQHYAHDPSQTASGGPFCGSYFGITPGGGYWHRDNPGAAMYAASIINILVWGYKLTGDAALLTRARVHLREATRWAEGQPAAGGGPLVGATEVADFIDTRRNTGGSIYFTDNKGQLQYVYQVFENSGAPTTLDSNVPAYIRNLTAGDGLAISNSRISDAFAGFTGQAGDPIGIYAFSGGAYDTARNRFIRHGGGHNDWNGNGVFGFSLYASETPTWTMFKAHTTPPSVTSLLDPAVETAPNGDPASSHTYNQIVYDATADKLVLMGLGSAAGSGSNFSRMRLLNLSTNAWDAISGSLQGSATSMFGAAFSYHDIERAIYGRGGQSSGRWFRYDCSAGTLTQLTVSGTGSAAPNIHSSCAIDPSRQYGIWIGGTVNGSPLDNGSVDMVLLDFSSRSGANITSYGRTLTGFPSALRADGIALEFHPPSGSFVAWKGGNTLYRLIPPSNPFTGTWTFTTVTPGGTALPSIASNYNRPWSGFRWAPYPNDPSRGVFVMDCAQGSGTMTASLVSIYKPNF